MDKTISDVVDKDDINYDSRLEKPVPFVPITIAGEQLSSEINNQFPLGVPSFFNKPAPIGQTITGNVIPGASLLKENKGKPGWWETAANTFYNYNLELQTGKFLYDSIAPNPLHEEIPEGWNAMNPDALEEFPMKYWPHISSALGPKDQAARQQKVREQIEKDEYIESGSFTAKLAGGAAGAIISPMTLFGLPAITTLKYAGVAQNVLMNMARTAPAIALDSFARNTMMEANRIGGTLEDVATSTLVDTAFGTSLIGLGAGIASGSKNLNLWNTRKAASLVIARGIGISEEVTKDGVLTGKRIAFPLPGSSANAAEVDFAQAWVNESMSKSGLFAIPGIGSAIEKGIMTPLGIKAFESPAITAAKSPYMAVKKWYNGIAGSPFITKDVEQGIAAPDSAQIIADQFSSQALNFRQMYKEQFHEANGISGSNPGSALKNMRQIITNNRQITTDKFDIEVHNIMEIEGYKSDWPQAHVVADAVHDLFNHVNEINAQQTGRPLFRNPRTAWLFLPHNKKMNRLRQREDEYNNITYDALLAQDKRIVELTAPITELESSIAEIKKSIKDKKSLDKKHPELENLNFQLRNAQSKLKKQNVILENNLLNNADDHILLEDRVFLTQDDRDELQALLKDLNAAKGKPEYEQIKLDLEDQVFSGKVKEHFYENDGYKIKFRDPEEPIKLRKAYENDRARWRQVRAWYESETNTSPQDLIQQVIGGMPETSGMPNNFKSRTKMIPSNVYTEAGFYDDLTKTVTAYMQTVGRNYGFKAVFPELANVKDFEGVFRALKQEHDAINAKILEKPVSKERDKEKAKSDKAFSNAKKFMSDTYKTYMGSYNAHENPKLRAAVSIAKSITSAEKLGGTLAYQIADMGGIIMKSGLMPFFRNGLVPLLKTMNGHIKGENSEAWINNAGYAGLACNTEISVLGNRMFNSSSMDTAPVSSFLDNAVSGANIASHYAGNFFGINSIANINERMAASTVQASIMDAAFKFRAGTITQLDKQNMAQIGIQIEEVAESFIKNFEESGGWKQGKNGYQSLYWKWSDTEAVTRMANSVRRGVQDSIINSSKYASPYWAQSPLLSMVFMFHGWAYNAFNRYAVPLMQRPDAQHMIGLTSIVGLSMMAEPLLNMSNGKPAYEDDKTLLDSAMRALDYSGFLGPTWDLLANINKATGQSLFQDTAQKRANYKGVGAMMGPVIGMGWDMAQLTGHSIKGDLTQGDAKQIAHMIPLLNHILNRNAVNDFVKLSGLPERRADAEPWSIWQK